MVSVELFSVASDGRLKAVFANNDVLLLSAGGSAFAHVSNGKVARQTSEYAVSSLAAALCAAI